MSYDMDKERLEREKTQRVREITRSGHRRMMPAADQLARPEVWLLILLNVGVLAVVVLVILGVF